MPHTRPAWSAVAVLALSCLSAPAQTTPAPAPAPAPSAVAAMVNGQPITEVALRRGLDRIPAEHQAEARPELLNYLIDTVLVDQYVQQFQVKVEKAEVDKTLDKVKTELKQTQNKEFDKFLAEMKLTEAELRDQILADLRWEKFATGQATDKVLADFFAGNKEMFDGSKVRARHILLTPTDAKGADAAVAQLRVLKQEIEAAAAAGVAKLPADADAAARERERIKLTVEAFAARAEKLSACPSGKATGGDINWFGRVDTMVEPFARAAYALKEYQMSEPVKTEFGYHLILVTDRKAGSEVKFDDKKEDVKAVYYHKLREAIVAQVRPKAKIEITPVKP
jgi:peptidyl-prolyl cis-trans isomerase C